MTAVGYKRTAGSGRTEPNIVPALQTASAHLAQLFPVADHPFRCFDLPAHAVASSVVPLGVQS